MQEINFDKTVVKTRAFMARFGALVYGVCSLYIYEARDLLLGDHHSISIADVDKACIIQFQCV